MTSAAVPHGRPSGACCAEIRPSNVLPVTVESVSAESPEPTPGLVTEPTPSEGRPSARATRDWIADGIRCLTLLALGGSFVPDLVTGSNGEARPAVELVTGVLAGVLIWGHRRWPAQITLLFALCSTFSMTMAIAALIALFSLALRRSLRVVVGLSVLLLITKYLYALFWPDPEVTAAVEEVVYLGFMVLISAAGMFVRTRRQLVLSLRERAVQVETEQHLRIDQARRTEREQMAREMHDVLGHRISMVSMHAGALEMSLSEAGGPAARSAAVIRSSAHQALDDLHEVVGILRSENDRERPTRQPTLADIRTLIDESRQAGLIIEADLRFEQTDDSAPMTLTHTAYRIVQEGLTNAHKHAPGGLVTVRIAGAAGPGLDIELLSSPSSDAAAYPRIPSGGRGLIGLAERAHLSGGRLEHGPTADGDFRLAAWLPWPA